MLVFPPACCSCLSDAKKEEEEGLLPLPSIAEVGAVIAVLCCCCCDCWAVVTRNGASSVRVSSTKSRSMAKVFASSRHPPWPPALYPSSVALFRTSFSSSPSSFPRPSSAFGSLPPPRRTVECWCCSTTNAPSRSSSCSWSGWWGRSLMLSGGASASPIVVATGILLPLVVVLRPSPSLSSRSSMRANCCCSPPPSLPRIFLLATAAPSTPATAARRWERTPANVSRAVCPSSSLATPRRVATEALLRPRE